jgi:hypothetical protein
MCLRKEVRPPWPRLLKKMSGLLLLSTYGPRFSLLAFKVLVWEETRSPALMLLNEKAQQALQAEIPHLPP